MRLLKRKLIWLTLGLMVLSMQVNAQEKAFDPSVLSAEGKKAYEELLKTGTFGIGPVDGLKAMSVGGESLDALIGEDRAVSALKDLVGNANNEGALFALLGLKTLECDCLKAEVKNFKERTAIAQNGEVMNLEFVRDSVNIMSGCLGTFQKKSEVLGDILSGKYDHWVNYRKMKKWSKEKGK